MIILYTVIYVNILVLLLPAIMCCFVPKLNALKAVILSNISMLVLEFRYNSSQQKLLNIIDTSSHDWSIFFLDKTSACCWRLSC